MKTGETDLKFAELVPRTSLVRGRVGLFVDEIRVIRFLPLSLINIFPTSIEKLIKLPHGVKLIKILHSLVKL